MKFNVYRILDFINQKLQKNYFLEMCSKILENCYIIKCFMIFLKELCAPQTGNYCPEPLVTKPEIFSVSFLKGDSSVDLTVF